MSISIDGTNISRDQGALTVDGEDVLEVTIDGTVCYVPIKVVDNFEGGDVSEYVENDETGSGSFQADSTASHDGTYGGLLRTEGGTTIGNGNSSAISTSGLDYYPSAGDTFEAWISTNLGVSNYELLFGMQGTGHPETINSGYGIGHDNNATEDWNIWRYDSGSRTIIASGTNSFDAGTNWIKVQVTWETNGSISGGIYDSSEDQQIWLDASDTAYTSGGIGVKFRGGVDPYEMSIDSIRII